MELRIVSKDQWQSLDKATQCQFPDCGQKFAKFDLFGGLNKKPGHCNICGLVCCKQCLSHDVKLPPRIPDPVPACPRCRQLVNAYCERQNAKVLKNAAGIEAERIRQISNESFALERHAHDLELHGQHQRDVNEFTKRIAETERQHADTVSRLVEKYEAKLEVLRQEIDQVNSDHVDQCEGMKKSYEERIRQLSASDQLTPYGSPESSPTSNNDERKSNNIHSIRLTPSQRQQIEDEIQARIKSREAEIVQKISNLEQQLEDEKIISGEVRKDLEQSKLETVSLRTKLASKEEELDVTRRKLSEYTASAEQRIANLQMECSEREGSLLRQQQDLQLLQSTKLDQVVQNAKLTEEKLSAQLSFLSDEKAKQDDAIKQLDEALTRQRENSATEQEKAQQEIFSFRDQVASLEGTLDDAKKSNELKVLRLVEDSQKILNEVREKHERSSQTQLDAERELFDERLRQTIAQFEDEMQSVLVAAAQEKDESNRNHEASTTRLSLEHQANMSALMEEHEKRMQHDHEQREKKFSCDLQAELERQKEEADEIARQQREVNEKSFQAELEEKLDALRFEISSSKDSEIERLRSELCKVEKQLETEHVHLINKVAGQQRRMWRLEDALARIGGKVPPVADDEDAGSTKRDDA